MIQKIFKNNNLKSITILASSSIIAQIICFFLVPVITRMYSPEEFARFTYILSLLSLFMGVINFRYDMSIVKVSDERDVFILIKGALLLGGIFTLLISIFIGIFFLFKEDFFWYHSLYFFLILLSYAIINVLTAYNNRNREYKIISSVNLIRPLAQNVGAILLGVLSFRASGLLLSYLLGQLLGLKEQNKSLRVHWRMISSIPLKDVKNQLIVHKDQLIYSTPAQFINGFSYSSLSIIIEWMFSLTILGYYSISVRLLGLPLSVISGNVSKIFYENASREFEKYHTYRKTLKYTFLFLFFLAVPMVLLMMTVVPSLCGYYLGEEWKKAGDYIFILAPMFGIRFIVTSLSPALIIVNKQKIDLYLQILFIVFVAISYFLTNIYNQSIVCFLTMISITFSVAYFLYLLAIIKFSNIK